MSHIVGAIGCEAARVRDDWETALLCAEAAERTADEQPARPPPHQQDNYCFEMLSLVSFVLHVFLLTRNSTFAI